MQGKVLATYLKRVNTCMQASMTPLLESSFAALIGPMGAWSGTCWAPFRSGWCWRGMMGLGNLRAIGSGNIGATNVLRTGNKQAAALTLVLDGGKGGGRGAGWRAIAAGGEDLAAQVAGTGRDDRALLSGVVAFCRW